MSEMLTRTDYKEAVRIESRLVQFAKDPTTENYQSIMDDIQFWFGGSSLPYFLNDVLNTAQYVYEQAERKTR